MENVPAIVEHEKGRISRLSNGHLGDILLDFRINPIALLHHRQLRRLWFVRRDVAGFLQYRFHLTAFRDESGGQ